MQFKRWGTMLLFQVLASTIVRRNGFSFAAYWEEDEENMPRLKSIGEAEEKGQKFQATWESLDKRRSPTWFDEAKVGIFVHWGVYSVPSFRSEWFWKHEKEGELEYTDFVQTRFSPSFEYQDFANAFTADMFNPYKWADILQASGARYFVFTSKHHDGFTNWPSNYSWNWNSVDLGPHQDLVGALEKTIRSQTNLRFGLYFSLYEWFNPTYLQDKKNNFKTQDYVRLKIVPQLKDLVMRYKPEYLWSDGDWEASSSYWNSTGILAWLYNESPVRNTIVVNDRWGKDANCVHGDVKTCKDRYLADKLENFKWENAMTIDKKSWGFRREAPLSDYYSIEDLIKLLVRTVSFGGNILINVGPTADGRITPIFEERLRQLGAWLKINGKAIYKSKPWRKQHDKLGQNVWYTRRGKNIFAIFCSWPKSGILTLKYPTATRQTSIKLLDAKSNIILQWNPRRHGGLYIDLSKIQYDSLSSKWAWTLEMSNVL